MNVSVLPVREKDLMKTTEEIPLANDINLPFLRNQIVEYKIDNTKEKVEIEINHPREYEVYLYQSGDTSNTYVLDYYTKDTIGEFQKMNELFKNHKRIDLRHNYQFKIKVTAKEDVILKLKNLYD